MKRFLLWIIMAAMFCSGALAEALDWKNVKVGITMSNDTLSYFVDVRETLRQAVENRGGILIEGVMGGKEMEIRNSIEAMILQGCELIVDFNHKSAAWADGFAQSILELYNVPIIEIDQKMQEPIYFVGGRQYLEGKLQATYVANWINENWNGQLDYCLLYYLRSNGEANWSREKAAADVVRYMLNLPDDRIIWVDISGADDALAEAMRQTRYFLSNHPDSKIYFSVHADYQASGVFRTAQQMGMLDNVVIGSHNADADALKQIQNCGGKYGWLVTVDCNHRNFGELCCQMYEDFVNGSARRDYYVEPMEVSIENVADYLAMENE